MIPEEMAELVRLNLLLIRILVVWVAVLTVAVVGLWAAKVVTLRRIAVLIRWVHELLELSKGYLQLADLTRKNARQTFAEEIGLKVKQQAKEGVKEAVTELTPISPLPPADLPKLSPGTSD